MWRRKPRVRIHLLEDGLPSVEGLLVSRRRGEYLVGVPQLITASGAQPAVLDSRLLAIPRERVAFYEHI